MFSLTGRTGALYLALGVKGGALGAVRARAHVRSCRCRMGGCFRGVRGWCTTEGPAPRRRDFRLGAPPPSCPPLATSPSGASCAGAVPLSCRALCLYTTHLAHKIFRDVTLTFEHNFPASSMVVRQRSMGAGCLPPRQAHLVQGDSLRRWRRCEMPCLCVALQEG